MKVVILAGGFGTRLSEETDLRPKPMVEIGGMPILWHIMKMYSHYGYNDFIICLGYKGYSIKEYFSNYFLHQSDVTFDFSKNDMKVHRSNTEQWKVSLINTGLNSMTGGRIKRVKDYLGDEPFLLTYGDGVSNVDIKQLVNFHKKNDKLLTVTAVKPSGRFGALSIEGNRVDSFIEKPRGDRAWINGGFFVCEQKVLDYILDDDTVFEKGPLENIAKDGQMNAFKHTGFWQPMDTLRDKNELEKLWNTGTAEWKTWGK